MSKKIIMTGGGTAGHVTPNLALMEPLKAEGFEISYIASKGTLTQPLIERAGIPFYPIQTGRLHRAFTWENLINPFKNIVGFFQSLRVMRKVKPNVVFAKGGFVSVPVVAAAWFRGIPVVSHESDYTPGLANRLCKNFAKVICTNFEETVQFLPKGKAVCTGTPIRRELGEGSREKGLALCGFTADKPVLLVMGGSQGAGPLNDSVRSALPELTKTFQIIHLCGRDNLAPELGDTPGYFQLEYANEELGDLYAASDIMLSRAGANALAEILMLALPAILVPLPAASGSRGDQVLNAESFEKKGYSVLLPQDEMTDERLVAEANRLYENRGQYRAAMQAMAGKTGTEAVMQQILKVMKPEKNTEK